jgi:hypothetical protein
MPQTFTLIGTTIQGDTVTLCTSDELVNCFYMLEAYEPLGLYETMSVTGSSQSTGAHPYLVYHKG